MVPCSEFGSIKSRCLKLTDKKQFPSSICAVYWRLYRQCKQPLRYLNKKQGLCLLSSYYIFKEATFGSRSSHYIVLCLPVFLLQRICSLSLAQLCHFFLSSRNTISDLTSSR